jgi:hypothetical protein
MTKEMMKFKYALENWSRKVKEILEESKPL